MSEEPALRAPTFAETVSLDNYKAAMGNALSAADSLADKVVTASFSVATAYGAVVALVAPKDSSSPLLILAPFIALGVAVALALFAQSLGISLTDTDDLGTIRTRINSMISSKRLWGRLALVALAAGIVIAGYAVRETYGPAATSTGSTTVRVWLTPAGTNLVARVCGGGRVTELAGQVDNADQLTDSRVPITVDAKACPAGKGTILLPQRAIAVTKEAS
jgi:hypothetical protein